MNSLREKQLEALFKSIEHYHENWRKPRRASVDAYDCACCSTFIDGKDYACGYCPINQAGYEGCMDTPWVKCDDLLTEYKEWGTVSKKKVRKAFKKEIEFLVDITWKLIEEEQNEINS